CVATWAGPVGAPWSFPEAPTPVTPIAMINMSVSVVTTDLVSVDLRNISFFLLFLIAYMDCLCDRFLVSSLDREVGRRPAASWLLLRSVWLIMRQRRPNLHR